MTATGMAGAIDKALGSAIEKAVDGAGNPIGDAFGALIGDRIASWRIANAARAAQKTQKLLKERGLKLVPGRLPERFALTWFENVSSTDEEEINELFARLLASVLTNGPDPYSTILSKIVGQMNGVEANLFEALYKSDPNGIPIQYHGLFEQDARFGSYNAEEIGKLVAGDMWQTSLERLENFNLIHREVNSTINLTTKSINYSSQQAAFRNLTNDLKTSIRHDFVFEATELGKMLFRATRD